MIFVIGGQYVGKLEYALSISNKTIDDVVDCATCEYSDIYNKSIIYNFHMLIKRLMEDGIKDKEIKRKILEFIDNNKDIYIISNEIGYGLVPIEKFDRRYRELVGRISCEIAQSAIEVHRVVCGVGNRIK